MYRIAIVALLLVAACEEEGVDETAAECFDFTEELAEAGIFCEPMESCVLDSNNDGAADSAWVIYGGERVDCVQTDCFDEIMAASAELCG